MATIIEMPKLSDTMSVGTLVKWHKKAGDEVKNGDILAEVETDKATMDLENFDDGILLKIFVEEGNEVPIGSPLAAVGEKGEVVDETETTPSQLPEKGEVVIEDDEIVENSQTAEVAVDVNPLQKNESAQVGVNIKTETFSITDRILVSPLAKKLALESKLDLKTIKGSGPNGRIIKKDIVSLLNYTINKEVPETNVATNNNTSGVLGDAPTSLSDYLVPVSKMRSIIAKRLHESKSTIPHFYLQKEINAVPLKNARTALNLKLSKKVWIKNL